MMSLLVFEGGLPESPVEGWLSEIRSRMAENLIGMALETGEFDDAFLLTDKELSVASSVEVIRSSAEGKFHFGAALQGILRERVKGGFCYFSGGSAQLLGQAGIAGFARAVRQACGGIVANNAFSADFFGSTDKVPFLLGELPPQDNSVPIYISERHQVQLTPLPFSTEASFDVDTPTDALVLLMQPECPASVSNAVGKRISGVPSGRMDAVLGRLHRMRGLMSKDFSDITLAGRVGPAAVQELNRTTRCRYRVFSEERGMRSFGRDEEGTARTIMAELAKDRGEGGLLELIMGQTEGLLFDDRVLFAASGAKPDAEQRYLSDIFAWEALQDGLPRRLAKAALHIEGVSLGGHSLVNSGAVLISKH
jgi:hypothetical protein